MLIRPGIIFAIIWIGWLLSWMIAAFWTSPTRKRVATWDVWLSRVLLLVGAALLFHTTRCLLREPMLWHVGYHGGYALAGVAFIGILFTWWARIHLGRLWSGTITLKQDHHVVDTGPYALVRHPVYTGLILSILATAAAQATFTGLLGAVAIVIGLWIKARVEERLLTTELGADAYGNYRRRVPMLVPLGPR
jgi:protein-S-isoprenylcysteine O-methyltransferase Ste14